MFDSRLKRCVAALGACALLASCSGGGSSIPSGQSIANAPAIPSIPAAKKRGAAAFTIVIPKATTASKSRLAQIALRAHGARRPQYVSAATQSLVVTLTSVNGTPVPSPEAYAINVGNASCTSPGGVTTCTLVVPATAGNDIFALATYDAAQSSPSPTSPSGNLLSKQTTTVSIAANTANVVNVPVTLNAVIASISLAFTGGYYWYGSQTVPISIQPRDAAGDLIIGPGALLDGSGNPLTVTLANADTSGTTTLSGTTFTATTLSTASLSYAGGPFSGGAAITVSAIGITGSTATFLPTNKPGTLFVGSDSGTELWDTTVSPAAHVTTIGGGSVKTAVALGPSGTLYQLVYSGTSIAQYASGSTTAASTTTSLSNNTSVSMALATSGRLYIALRAAPFSAGPAPIYLNSGSSTPVSAAGTYEDAKAVAVEPMSQRLVVVDDYARKIFAYGSDLTQAPSTIVDFTANSGTIEPSGLAFRPDGTLFVTDATTGNLYSISTPLGSPGSPTLVATSAAGAGTLAFDAGGNMYISNYNNRTIYKVLAGASQPSAASVLLTINSTEPQELVIAP